MKYKLKKPTKNQVKRFLFHAFCVVIGNALAAAATAFFIVPNDFVMGGATGIGIFVRNLTGMEWAVTLTVYIANIVLFLLGAIFLGKKFAAATLAGTLLYPTFMAIYKPLNELYMQANGGVAMGSGEPILAAIMGALLFGVGLGIVMHVGASTGGTDIPPMIFHKYFNVPVSVSLILIDGLIVVVNLFASSLDMALYGVVITVLSSVVVDMVSPIGTKRAQVKIISKKHKEIREMILDKMNRGVTMLYGKSGYLQQKCFVILTVISNRDVIKLKNEVYKIDPEAFLIVSVISEVRGNGFSTEQVALPKPEYGEDLEDVTEQYHAGSFSAPEPPRNENGERE